MPEMTDREFKACYDLGMQVYGGKSRADAIGELVDKYGMREASAGPYIQAVVSMMKGAKLNWSVSQGFVRYYFKNILNDTNYGKNQIKVSLNCLEQHIEYYFNKEKSSKVPGLRKLYNEYSELVGLPKRL